MSPRSIRRFLREMAGAGAAVSTGHLFGDFAKAPYLDIEGTFEARNGVVSLVVLNRDLAKPPQLEVNWEGKAATKLTTSLVLTGVDLKAVNDFCAPTRVVPKETDKPVTNGGRTTIELPPRSYSVYQWQA